MNSRRVLLLLWVSNLALIGAVLFLVRERRAPAAVGQAALEPEIIVNTVTQISVRKFNSTNSLLASLAGRPLSWRSLESTNYFQFIANLRAFDCPEETVRDIIITDVAKLYGKRRSEIRARFPEPKFWQPHDPLGGPVEPVALQMRLRALDKEQRELIRELLGVDLQMELARYTGESESMERSYSFLPPVKQEQARALARHYDDLEQALYIRTRGWLLDEDQAELRQIQRARRDQLATLLNSEEFEEHELRFSETANSLRTLMTGFQPSEEEFRKVFRLQSEFDRKFELDAGSDPGSTDEATLVAQTRMHDRAQEKLMEEIRNTLGPERFAEYERSQDGDYRQLLQLGARVDMPSDVANRVFAMKQAAERAKIQVENNARLSPEDRARNIRELAKITSRAVEGAMGEDVYRIYELNGGQWLGGLSMFDESAVPRPEPPGTRLDYDIRQLPPDLQQYLLNPALFLRPEFRPNLLPNNP